MDELGATMSCDDFAKGYVLELDELSIYANQYDETSHDHGLASYASYGSCYSCNVEDFRKGEEFK